MFVSLRLKIMQRNTMNVLKFLPLLAMAASTMFVSCSDSEEEVTPPKQEETETGFKLSTTPSPFAGTYSYNVGGLDYPSERDTMYIRKIDEEYCRIDFSSIPASPGLTMTGVYVDSIAYAVEPDSSITLSAPAAIARGTMNGRTYDFDRTQSRFTGTIKDETLSYSFTFIIGKMPFLVRSSFSGTYMAESK